VTSNLNSSPAIKIAEHGCLIVLRKATHGPEWQVFITPDCTSADEIEGYINAMQAELDEVRRQAQRAFREA
jgi:hypothetical protein